MEERNIVSISNMLFCILITGVIIFCVILTGEYFNDYHDKIIDKGKNIVIDTQNKLQQLNYKIISLDNDKQFKGVLNGHTSGIGILGSGVMTGRITGEQKTFNTYEILCMMNNCIEIFNLPKGKLKIYDDSSCTMKIKLTNQFNNIDYIYIKHSYNKNISLYNDIMNYIHSNNMLCEYPKLENEIKNNLTIELYLPHDSINYYIRLN